MAFQLPQTTQVEGFRAPAVAQPNFAYLGAALQGSMAAVEKRRTAEAELAQEQAMMEAQQEWLTALGDLPGAGEEREVMPAEYHEAGRLLLGENGEEAFRTYFGDKLSDDQLTVAIAMMTAPRKVKVFDPQLLTQVAGAGAAAGFKPSDVKTLMQNATGEAFAGDEDMRQSLTMEMRQSFDSLIPRSTVQKEQTFLGPSEPRDRVLASMGDIGTIIPDWRDRLGHQFSAELARNPSFFMSNKPVLSMTETGPQIFFDPGSAPTEDDRKMLATLNMAFQDPKLALRARALYGHGLEISEGQMRALSKEQPSFLGGSVPRGTSAPADSNLNFLKGSEAMDEPQVGKELLRYLGG